MIKLFTHVMLNYIFKRFYLAIDFLTAFIIKYLKKTFKYLLIFNILFIHN